MIWNGCREQCFRDTLHNLVNNFLPSLAMGQEHGTAPLNRRGQSSTTGQSLRQLCLLMIHILEGPSLEPIWGSVTNRSRLTRRKITPAGFASLLFGIASTLIFIGSTAFMIGVMMMPLIAMVATTFCFIGVFTNLTVPVKWTSFRNDHDHENEEDCVLPEPS
eukprot:TRINITY_DN6204_c0_g1_i1.p1 TRINITY_DN6204_c0_g1~~TRINITY_DN6204_c0_g1_i1.p1  ORF type:complete len:162 (+),score=9.49 TRINITY_DN6204_c0_g1_i1:265-750(+)